MIYLCSRNEKETIMNKAIDQNFNLHIKELPAQLSYMQVFEKPGLTYIDSALPVDTYNVIHITDSETLTFESLKEAVLFYENRLRKSCIWIEAENCTAKVLDYFKELDIKQQGTNAGMYAKAENICDGKFNKNIIPVMDQQAILDHAFVIANNWDPFDTNVLKYYNALASKIIQNNHLILLSYIEEGVTVGTIELMIEKDNESKAGIYNLSVMKENRNKGIGTALVQHTIEMAKTKNVSTFLTQTSDDSKGIFAKLGFEETGKWLEYSR